MAWLVVLALCAVHVAGSSGDHKYEAALLFETPQSTYTWRAENPGDNLFGGWGDPSMMVALIPASASTAAAMDAAEPSGNSALREEGSEGDCIDVTDGGTLTPQLGVCYRLVFNQNAQTTVFTVDTSSSAYTAFFCQHYPSEFGFDLVQAGQDIEPVQELPRFPTSTSTSTTSTSTTDLLQQIHQQLLQQASSPASSDAPAGTRLASVAVAVMALAVAAVM